MDRGTGFSDFGVREAEAAQSIRWRRLERKPRCLARCNGIACDFPEIRCIVEVFACLSRELRHFGVFRNCMKDECRYIV